MLHPFTQIICTRCGAMHPVPVYCGDRFCPICSVRRLARVRHRLGWLIEQGKLKQLGQFRHVTLTIVSHDSLRPMVRRLLNGFKRLRSRRIWRMSVKGGAYVVEVTSSNAGWHAHLHIIVQGGFIPWRELRDAWKAITGATGCYITRIPASACLAYLTKYMSKPEVPDTDLPMATDCMSKVRLFNPFGAWHSINKAYTPPLHPCLNCGAVGSYLPAWLCYSAPKWELLDTETLQPIGNTRASPAVA